MLSTILAIGTSTALALVLLAQASFGVGIRIVEPTPPSPPTVQSEPLPPSAPSTTPAETQVIQEIEAAAKVLQQEQQQDQP